MAFWRAALLEGCMRDSAWQVDPGMTQSSGVVLQSACRKTGVFAELQTHSGAIMIN